VETIAEGHVIIELVGLTVSYMLYSSCRYELDCFILHCVTKYSYCCHNCTAWHVICIHVLHCFADVFRWTCISLLLYPLSLTTYSEPLCHLEQTNTFHIRFNVISPGLSCLPGTLALSVRTSDIWNTVCAVLKIETKGLLGRLF